MSSMLITYRGKYSSTLYTAQFDGSKWSGNTEIGSQLDELALTSPNTPSACLLNNQLFLIYRKSGTDDLYMGSYSGTKWSGTQRIGDMPGAITARSPLAPAVATYRGLLYIVYKATGSNDICMARFNGSLWEDLSPAVLPDGSRPHTDSAPTIAVLKDKLHVIFRGSDSKDLHAAWYDGQTWGGNRKILIGSGGPASKSSPRAVTYQDKLYVFYNGAHLDTLYASWFDGESWNGNSPIAELPGDISPKSSYAPGAGVFDGKIYLVYGGSWSDDLRTCWFDGNTWQGDKKISSQSGGIDPASADTPGVAILPFPVNTRSHWLRDISNDTPICDINLPGTHDSGAFDREIRQDTVADPALALAHVTPVGSTALKIAGLWSCQNLRINEQLNAGIRLLDLRLEFYENGSDITFYICHSDNVPDLARFEQFKTVLNYCRDFLQAEPSEFIVMSLKVDNWGDTERNNPVSRERAFGKLRALLDAYPILVSDTLPTAGAARGKIVLLNRIWEDPRFGPYIDIPDSTKGTLLPGGSGTRKFDVFVQDHYDSTNLWNNNEEKYQLVKNAFSHKVDGLTVLNFGSGVLFKLGRADINPLFVRDLGSKGAEQRPTKMGWLLLDYATTPISTRNKQSVNCVELIIASNFGYRGYEKPFV